MKNLMRQIFFTTAVIVTFYLPQIARSNPLSMNSSPPPTIQLTTQIPQDALQFTQALSGQPALNCNRTPTVANWVIEMTRPFPYLRFSIQSAGEPVLIIEGPGGRFCVLADNYSGSNPEISGLWDAGTYKIYIGNRIPGDYAYTLKISQKPN